MHFICLKCEPNWLEEAIEERDRESDSDSDESEDEDEDCPSNEDEYPKSHQKTSSSSAGKQFDQVIIHSRGNIP